MELVWRRKPQLRHCIFVNLAGCVYMMSSGDDNQFCRISPLRFQRVVTEMIGLRPVTRDVHIA